MVRQANEGNPVEALKAFSSALGNMAQAAVGESRTTHHRVKSRYEDAYDRIVHVLGFRNVKESENGFIVNYEYEQKKKRAEEKKDAIQPYLDDPSAGVSLAQALRWNEGILFLGTPSVPRSPSTSQKVPSTTKRGPGSSFGNMGYAPTRHGTTARWDARTERTTRRLMRATSSIPLRISRGSWLGAIESAMHSRCVHWAGIHQTNVWKNIWLSVT